MTYIQCPHDIFTWDSDGNYTGQFAAKDGSMHDSVEQAMAHNKKIEAARARAERKHEEG